MDCFAALAKTGLDFMDGFARSQLLRARAMTEFGFLKIRRIDTTLRQRACFIMARDYAPTSP
jgi:hypothetical protein